MNDETGAEGITRLIAQERQLFRVIRLHRRGQLHFEDDESTFGQVGNQVDLMVATGRTQVAEPPAQSLGLSSGTYLSDRSALEQLAQPTAVARKHRSSLEVIGGCECGIDEVPFWPLGQALEPVVRPAMQLFDEAHPVKQIVIRLSRRLRDVGSTMDGRMLGSGADHGPVRLDIPTQLSRMACTGRNLGKVTRDGQVQARTHSYSIIH